MSDKEPSFQEFFGLSDEEKEAFEEACEIAVSSDKELESKDNETNIKEGHRCKVKTFESKGMLLRYIDEKSSDKEQTKQDIINKHKQKLKEHKDAFQNIALIDDEDK